MVNRLPHQILSPDAQEKLDKEQIEQMLRKHNLDENVDLVYELIKLCSKNGDRIDECIEKLIMQFDGIKTS